MASVSALSLAALSLAALCLAALCLAALSFSAPRLAALCFSAPRLTPLLLISGLLATPGCKNEDQSTPSSDTASSSDQEKPTTPSAQSTATSARLSPITDLGPADFQKRYAELGGTLLDVRTPEEIARGRLEGSSVVDIRDPQFRSKIDKLAKDRPVFVYCHSGGRSARAAKILRELGVQQVYNLDGGISAWNRAKLPTVSEPLAQPAAPAKETTVAEFDARLKQNSVVLAEFQTQWCAPCVSMRPIVAKLEEKHGNDKVIVVDVDASEALAEREKATGVPVFVLYKKSKEIFRHSGALTFEQLDEELAKAL